MKVLLIIFFVIVTIQTIRSIHNKKLKYLEVSKKITEEKEKARKLDLYKSYLHGATNTLIFIRIMSNPPSQKWLEENFGKTQEQIIEELLTLNTIPKENNITFH